jgi:hypothetical protein
MAKMPAIRKEIERVDIVIALARIGRANRKWWWPHRADAILSLIQHSAT